ncbi:MAG: UvrD-helicase domain-containing protein [Alphaproteobacteria bacterium]|nr:MAG: UvrD-helicase domain-containing protein [Alphaproteobacteria bacterium]
MKATWINASAGTGKTTALKNQCLELLNKGVKPQNILCITFTNNAAREMQERIQSATSSRGASLRGDLMDDYASLAMTPSTDLQIKTIHSVAQNIVQSIKNIEIPRIFDDYDQEIILRKAVSKYFQENPAAAKELSNQYSYYHFLSLIKKVLYKTRTPVATFLYKEQTAPEPVEHPDLYLTTKGTVRKKLAPALAAQAEQVYQQVQNIKTHEWMEKNYKLLYHINHIMKHYLELKNGYDFNDLILEATELLNDPANLYQATKNFHHVLLDEAQDTSFHQWIFFKKLIENAQSVFVVGDEKQSIYSFQDASPQYYQDFKDYLRSISDFEEKTLTNNYRSLKTITDLAKEKCPNLNIPPQENHRKGEGHYEVVSDLGHIRAILSHTQKDPSAALQDNGDKNAQDDARYIQPQDILLLFRKRDQTFENALEFLKENNIPVNVDKKHPLQDEPLIKELMHLINLQIYHPNDPYSLFFYERSTLKQKGVPMQFNDVAEMVAALMNVVPEPMFIALIDVLANLQAPTFYLLREYLENHAIYYESDKETNAVSLMTIHSAKGLQFPIVYLFDSNDREPYEPFMYDIATNSLYTTPPSDLYHESITQIREQKKLLKQQENERLLYVAITRAKDRFYFVSNE